MSYTPILEHSFTSPSFFRVRYLEGVGLVTAGTRDLYQKPWRLSIFEGNSKFLTLNWKPLDHHYYVGITFCQELSGERYLVGDPAHPSDSGDHPEERAQVQSKIKGPSDPPFFKGQTTGQG